MVYQTYNETKLLYRATGKLPGKVFSFNFLNATTIFLYAKNNDEIRVLQETLSANVIAI